MNTGDPQELLQKHRNHGCIVDSSLVLLYVVGQYDVSWISSFKRTRKYTKEDFDLLCQLITWLGDIVTTPNVLTEVSNLSGQLPNRVKDKFFGAFRAHIGVMREQYDPSGTACQNPHFERLGLTDCVIADISAAPQLVLTDDLALFGTLDKLGRDVINFNHLRYLTLSIGEHTRPT